MEKVKRLFAGAIAAVCCIFINVSCSSDDYIDAIPAASKALVSVDMKSEDAQNTLANAQILKSMLGIEKAEDCGIDLKEKLYFFENEEGMVGLCAKVSDKDDLTELFNNLAKAGKATKPTERRDFTFSLLNGSWAAGYSKEALIIVGPILPAQQAETIKSITRWLKQDDDSGITGKPIFEKLQSQEGAVTMVARADALPQTVGAMLTIGTPQGIDDSDVFIAATLSKDNAECLSINAETFATDEKADKALKAETAKMCPIGGRFVSSAHSDALCSIFINAKGSDFVDMMHNNKDLGVILAGANTAIDMDNILRSVEGNLLISVAAYSDESAQLSIAAELANENFVKDIPYWKKSSPAGATIETLGKNAYAYKSSNENFWFGISDKKEFYGSTDQALAPGILSASASPLPQAVKQAIPGKRFCITMNLQRLLGGNEQFAAVQGIIAPLLGNIKYIVYNIK